MRRGNAKVFAYGMKVIVKRRGRAGIGADQCLQAPELFALRGQLQFLDGRIVVAAPRPGFPGPSLPAQGDDHLLAPAPAMPVEIAHGGLVEPDAARGAPRGAQQEIHVDAMGILRQQAGMGDIGIGIRREGVFPE